jgi:hypothetical protein
VIEPRSVQLLPASIEVKTLPIAETPMNVQGMAGNTDTKSMSASFGSASRDHALSGIAGWLQPALLLFDPPNAGTDSVSAHKMKTMDPAASFFRMSREAAGPPTARRTYYLPECLNMWLLFHSDAPFQKGWICA